MTQLGLARLDHPNNKRRMKRQRLLGEMPPVALWPTPLGWIEPHYIKASKRRRPSTSVLCLKPMISRRRASRPSALTLKSKTSYCVMEAAR